ncbi:SDR family oxidoreductase [Agrobacterium vitis]|uniref:SDR family oxidoreductase n=1 Tax=Agrobacterium vitis TaxID=373 RepID=UPI000872D2B2|nr:SDR family oxidoreductase [Agrobacterium vitis]MCE6074448.1 SDR family oxidoreductase [Agrobacterium vitis]MCM2470283.1 SDR family oxidoreductase [Agrobacterium vitis]MUO70772.1 SDR family oxidoreductase [Agrobacterium vitis]MUO84513.1 SDR family oxidoreductase [Agrobacterium vitis]MVA35142.1 SDR family oxidoreductase [Agrobacterium vitis]
MSAPRPTAGPQTAPRTALVTASAKRIGRAIAEDLADNGFAVAIHTHASLHEAETLADQICSKGGKAVALKADLRDIAETQALIANASQALGPLGLLVNNASVFVDDKADQFNAEHFAAHFDIHVRAPAILSAEFHRQVPDNGAGLIVNIIDQRVLALKPTFFSYTLSKSTLWTATRTMAQAFAPQIRVNAIGPGPTLKSERQEQKDFQAQIDSLPLKQGAGLEEFGRTIRFLFDTPSITGQMFALDGGQHLIWPGANGTEIAE